MTHTQMCSLFEHVESETRVSGVFFFLYQMPLADKVVLRNAKARRKLNTVINACTFFQNCFSLLKYDSKIQRFYSDKRKCIVEHAKINTV